jgi:predicted amidohydrolase
MALLLKSGAYPKALLHWPPKGRGVRNWTKSIIKISKEWRIGCLRKRVPREVIGWWNKVLQYQELNVSDIGEYQDLSQCLLELCAAADDACVGVGIPLDPAVRLTKTELTFYNFADHLLARDWCGSTLGRELHPLKGRVLPKMHTPQNGLTTRSLSHHLALCTATDIKARWVLTPNKISQESINILLIPWPMDFMPAQFKETPPLAAEMRNMPLDRFGFFTIESRNNGEQLLKHVSKLHAAAEKRLGVIDWVVLPEAALRPADYRQLLKILAAKNCALISGIGSPSTKHRHGTNLIRVDIPFVETFTQRKHHRWKLDFSQVKQYGLGSRLNPERSWWEHIDLSDRQLLFLSLRPWMVLSVLICEDLARPDPVGDLVRAVGPTLVLALLMDGPQLKERWGARYATALADDPGSSVLTVTSTGMSKLSHPSSGASRSRVVALWKDALSGAPSEIELEKNAEALVVSLTVRYREEWSADGRTDGESTGYALISGIHSITKDIK